MARIDTLGHFLTDVADAIREKKGTEETIVASDFDTEIENLPSGGGADLSDYFTDTVVGNTNNRKSFPQQIIKQMDNITIDTHGEYSLFNCSNLVSATNIKVSSNITSLLAAFQNCTSLKNVSIDIYGQGARVTSLNYMFQHCSSLVNAPNLEFTWAYSIDYMFSGCTSLINLGVYNFSYVRSATGIFNNCTNLTNDSLNNLLATCISGTNINNKTLTYLFGNQDMSQYYPASTIQSLPNYQAFIDAGWTIGW